MPPSIISLSTTNDNKSIFNCATNHKKSVCVLYEIGSLHKTKGTDPSIISYYISSCINTLKHTIYMAIHYPRWQKPSPYTFTVSKSFIGEHQKQFNRLYKPSAYYNTTFFSWPTRNRVFNMMSNPASSMFLQNATSSEHMSTSSNPSFPRIR